jgi:hypothetical protein
MPVLSMSKRYSTTGCIEARQAAKYENYEMFIIIIIFVAFRLGGKLTLNKELT